MKTEKIHTDESAQALEHVMWEKSCGKSGGFVDFLFLEMIDHLQMLAVFYPEQQSVTHFKINIRSAWNKNGRYCWKYGFLCIPALYMCVYKTVNRCLYILSEIFRLFTRAPFFILWVCVFFGSDLYIPPALKLIVFTGWYL